MQTEQNKVVVRGLIEYLLLAIWHVTRIYPTGHDQTAPINFARLSFGV